MSTIDVSMYFCTCTTYNIKIITNKCQISECRMYTHVHRMVSAYAIARHWCRDRKQNHFVPDYFRHKVERFSFRLVYQFILVFIAYCRCRCRCRYRWRSFISRFDIFISFFVFFRFVLTRATTLAYVVDSHYIDICIGTATVLWTVDWCV